MHKLLLNNASHSPSSLSMALGEGVVKSSPSPLESSHSSSWSSFTPQRYKTPASKIHRHRSTGPRRHNSSLGEETLTINYICAASFSLPFDTSLWFSGARPGGCQGPCRCRRGRGGGRGAPFSGDKLGPFQGPLTFFRTNRNYDNNNKWAGGKNPG